MGERFLIYFASKKGMQQALDQATEGKYRYMYEKDISRFQHPWFLAEEGGNKMNKATIATVREK